MEIAVEFCSYSLLEKLLKNIHHNLILQGPINTGTTKKASSQSINPNLPGLFHLWKGEKVRNE